jgi:hypothetical protein
VVTGYLDRLVARAAGGVGGLAPRRRSRFEATPDGPLSVEPVEPVEPTAAAGTVPSPGVMAVGAVASDPHRPPGTLPSTVVPSAATTDRGDAPKRSSRMVVRAVPSIPAGEARSAPPAPTPRLASGPPATLVASSLAQAPLPAERRPAAAGPPRQPDGANVRDIAPVAYRRTHGSEKSAGSTIVAPSAVQDLAATEALERDGHPPGRVASPGVQRSPLRTAPARADLAEPVLVEVTIGRVEIRAVQEPGPTTALSSSAPSLSDYLRDRRGAR